MSNLSDYKKAAQEFANTQPDHIVDMHEMVTDTNQASEDELEHELDNIVHDALGEVFCPDCEHPRCLNKVKLYKTAIRAIIHTEKLKLLAEVRERVVGESDYQPGNPAPDLVEHNQLVRDGLRFEQRVELNKLEAEL